MSRWFFAVALLPLCTGCLYYAYPTISHTPELAVANPDGSVHAFRVDIDRTERKPLPTATQYTLSSITVDSRGLIPSQLEVAHASGVLNPLNVIEGGQHERSQYTMLIRLYKPGSRTIEVKAWEKSRELPWIPAAELTAQEKAIDDLLAVPSFADAPAKGTWWEMKDDKSPPFGLQPGANASNQRQSLLFAANEYQRLAGSPIAASLNLQMIRDRLNQKSAWLRRFADQGYVQ